MLAVSNQSINQSKHISIAPYVASESEAHLQRCPFPARRLRPPFRRCDERTKRCIPGQVRTYGLMPLSAGVWDSDDDCILRPTGWKTGSVDDLRRHGVELMHTILQSTPRRRSIRYIYIQCCRKCTVVQACVCSATRMLPYRHDKRLQRLQKKQLLIIKSNQLY